jgi:hypothetical protein
MNTGTAVTQSPRHSLQVVRALLEQNREQIQRALPKHIPVDRFNREVETLLQRHKDADVAGRRIDGPNERHRDYQGQAFGCGKTFDFLPSRRLTMKLLGA